MARGVPTLCCKVSTFAPKLWTGFETTPGHGRRRSPSRAISSAGPTGSPTARTISRTPSMPGSWRQMVFRRKSSKCVDERDGSS